METFPRDGSSSEVICSSEANLDINEITWNAIMENLSLDLNTNHSQGNLSTPVSRKDGFYGRFNGVFFSCTSHSSAATEPTPHIYRNKMR